MLAKLKQFLTQNADAKEADAVKDMSQTQTRLAAAALLVHASRIDGEVTVDEDEKLKALLISHFSVSQAELDELIATADNAEREAVDLYRFTSVLCRHLEQDGRKEIVEMLWGIVLADDVIHEFEDNLVWRVSELLGVSTRDRMILKKKAKETRAGAGTEPAAATTATTATDNDTGP